MGLLLAREHKLDEAVQLTGKLVKSHPNFIDGYIFHGNLLRKLERYPQAIAALTRGIKRSPKETVLFTNRGLAYRNMGNTEKALEDYSRAIELDENVLAIHNRGQLYLSQGDTDKALADFNRALKASKADFIYRGIAMVYAKKGNNGEESMRLK